MLGATVSASGTSSNKAVSRVKYNKKYEINSPCQCGSRLHVILDLDASVINSLSLHSELTKAPEAFQKRFVYHDMPGYYRIFERPYLQFFLDYLFSIADVSIFTAADKDYALFIADNIITPKNKPGRHLKYLFYGYTSGLSENYYKSPKDLRILWDVFQLPEFNKCNTVIIDDLKEVYEANPGNAIQAPKFELLGKNGQSDYNQVHDNFLLGIIPLLDSKREELRKLPCGHQLGQFHRLPCNNC
jgi:TFIIF-interacting CTD phosphatase-like protein